MNGRRIFVFVFIAFSIWAIMTGLRMGMEGWQAKSWPLAKGRMIKSRFSEYRTKNGIRIARLCLDIDYLYMVNDKIFEGRRYDAGWKCFASEDNIKDIIKRYPTGREIKVYYNPSNPSISMIQPGIPWASFLLCGVGIIIFTVIWPVFKQCIYAGKR
jgi:hypothetical protein